MLTAHSDATMLKRQQVEVAETLAFEGGESS